MAKHFVKCVFLATIVAAHRFSGVICTKRLSSPKISPNAGKNAREAVAVKYVLQLSKEELDAAARTSYEFASSSRQHPSFVDETTRYQYAAKMAERHFQAEPPERRNWTKALRKMRRTLQFRRTMNIDGLREAGTHPSSDDHLLVQKFLSSGKVYVSGFDKDGRSTYVFIPKHADKKEPRKCTVRGHLWSLEKAIACSKSTDRTLNVVVDFRGFSLHHNAPHVAVGKEVMTILRRHYVGYIHQIFLLDAPASFLCLWNVLKPFAGREARSKIHFCCSTGEDKQKLPVATLSRWYTPDQVASLLCQRALNVKDYFASLPFDRALE
jgi:hypothetical protein